ncbi:hypothetical protein [Burkholderia sp. D-99]|uniref:hypothetical protein n=1 Tax=Burkholderia sp. D-99 TaxID=2717316 RepID=UPI00141DFB4B|nr:hypothetical protein [Burkholderia sp. D-99]NHV25855.1 hypothetical protein [Burkholderia sp. D-99]
MNESSGNQPTRKPIHFSSRDEFEVRPNYVAALRCVHDDLDYIVGKYGFSKDKQLQCGLNGCNHWHQHGFIVATKSGLETHCGQDCGQREFGVVWDELTAEFERQTKAETRRKLIEDMLKDRDELLSHAREMQTRLSGACRQIRVVLDEVAKESAFSSALDRVLMDGGRIMVAVKIDKGIGAAPGQRGANANIATIGVVRGVDAVAKCQTVGSSFEWQVVRPLLSLTADSVEAMSDKEIATSVIKMRDFRTELQAANAFLASAAQFLSIDNLTAFERLKETLPSRARTSRLERIFARLPTLLASAA